MLLPRALCSTAEAVAPPPLLRRPITGTFLDIRYDGRLKYANNVTLRMSCADWAGKIRELKVLGIGYIIFQAVHDNRFGAFYDSTIHAHWKGACPDVVRTIMLAAAHEKIRVWLSCEYTNTDADGVTNSTLMDGRRAIMAELVSKGYTALPSFHGWYFSSEAFLVPSADCPACFPEEFFKYINTMSNWSSVLTPGAKKFVSPYGTKIAQASSAFVAQLRRLEVDVVAYQDEVGCIRDEFPVETARAAFQQLRAAHDRSGTPALWGNLESFTWEAVPNLGGFPGSALIPAPFPRILAQLDRVHAPHVDALITFTVQAIFQPPATASSAPSWGPPAATREWTAYKAALSAGPTSSERLLAAAVHGAVEHAAVGWTVSYPSNQPDPTMAAGRLTDGLTGSQTHLDRRWVGFAPAADAVVVLAVPTDAVWPPRSLAAHFLAVPPVWFRDGDHSKPVARNFTSWLPSEVRWATAQTADGPWVDIGKPLGTDWWEREVYDIRTEVYAQVFRPPAEGGRVSMRPRYLRMTAKSSPPPWWAAWQKQVQPVVPALKEGRLVLDELIVDFILA